MGKVGGVMWFFWNLVICKLDVGYSSCIHIGCVLFFRPWMYPLYLMFLQVNTTGLWLNVLFPHVLFDQNMMIQRRLLLLFIQLYHLPY